MKTLAVIFTLAASIAFAACGKKSVSYNTNIPVIDLDNLPLEKEVLMSSFFYKVTPIFIGNNDSLLIGEIERIQVFDDKIYILDRSGRGKLCVLNKDGQFLYQIGRSGNGPGEYAGVADFSIDRKNKKVYILDDRTGMIFKYHIQDGRYDSSTLIAHIKAPTGIQSHNGILYMDANNKENHKDGYLLEKIDLSDGQVYGHWLKSSEYNRNWMRPSMIFGGFFFSRTEGDPKFAQLFMDTIISIKENSIEPFLYIKDKNWITASELNGLFDKDPQILFETIRNNKKTCGVHNYAECGEMVFFSLYKNGVPVHILYNTRTKETHLCEYLMDDILFGDPRSTWGSMLAADSKGIYFVLDSFLTGKFVEAGVVNIKPAIANKYKGFSELSEDSNPLILYYEYTPQ